MQSARKATTANSARTNPALESLLKTLVKGKDLLKVKSGTTLFSQGELGKALYFIQKGKIQLTVVSAQGKEAVLAILGPFDFLGEECLVGDSRRTSTATGMGPSMVFRIKKRAMLHALHTNPKFSEDFIASLLARTINLEEDLSDQLFNHSERRLACALLNLARKNQTERLSDTRLPKITQEVLAEIVGTTRSKVSSFLKKFRNLGLVDLSGGGNITVRSERLTEAVLHD